MKGENVNSAIGLRSALLVIALLFPAAAAAQLNTVFVSQNVPAVMTPGQTYPVSVTMKNTGVWGWDPSLGFDLGSQNPQDNTTWGLNRVPLTEIIYTNEEVTFNFDVTAPGTSGWYNFRWRMVNDTYGWFGAYTPNLSVNVGLNNAQFVSQEVPTVVAPGESYPVSVTMKNTGATTWTAAGNYRLGSQSPQDNTKWGLNRVPLPNSVAPGETVTFIFNITAPTTKGTHNFEWKMVQDGVQWFGPPSTTIAVKVGLNDAEFLSQSLPPVVQPGQTYPVSVTMKNTGGSTWSPGGDYKLGSQNPQDNTTWGTNRVYMSAGSSVGPGQSFAFTFNVTAPSTAGTYNFQWKMVQDGVEWFGRLSANVVVKNGLDDAEVLSQTVPAIMTPGQTYPVSVTMKNTGSTTWSAATVALGSHNPTDNTTWGFNRVPLPSGVAPGGTATFDFSVTAPTTPGSYDFQWRMVEGELGWFGDATTNVAVQNGLDGAQFVSQSVPTSMAPGQTYPVSVTMKNTGSATWPAGSTYRLGSQNPQDNSVWGLSRVDLAAPVPPETNVTFNFDVTAPVASGPYNFQWRMLMGEADWFGAPSANVLVNVGSTQSNLFFIHVDHLNTPRLVADATGTTVWKWNQQEPFGSNPADQNPSGLGTFDLPLRLPGQTYDVETGLHYNYYRDYDPSLGRYGESDPIGLKGGLNTYAYVGGRPISAVDPRGLFSADVHFKVTMLSTHGIACQKIKPASLAWKTVMADWGTQSPLDAHRHSMCEPFPPYAGYCESKTDTFIENELSKCSIEGLANALHATQDGFAPGHGSNTRWGGGWPGWRHIWGDKYPSSETRDGAVTASRTLIERFISRCGCCE